MDEKKHSFMQDLADSDYKKNIDFKFSFDEINFRDKTDIVEKLGTVIKEISKLEFDISYKKSWEKNVKLTGKQEEDQAKIEKAEKKLEDKNIKVLSKEIGENEKGDTVMKYQVEKKYAKFSNFDKSLFSIHTEGKNTSKGVKPHIHIVSPRKYFGKNNSLLKKEISRICKENKIISSLNTQVKHKGILLDKSNEYRVLKDRLSNFSWVVAKHQDPKYIIQQFSKIERIKSKDKNIITLKNVEKKLNKFLDYGGSFSFALKLKEDLSSKLGINLKVKTPKEFIEAEKIMNTKDFLKIAGYIKDQVMSGEKVSEYFRDVANDLKGSERLEDKLMAEYIKDQFINSGFTYNDKFQKVIDRSEVKNTFKQLKKDYRGLDRVREINDFKEAIKYRYLTEKDLKEDMKDYNIKKSELQEITGKTIPQIIFEGIENNVNQYALDHVFNKRDYMQRFDSLEFKVNDKWKEQMFQNAMEKYVNKNYDTNLKSNEKIFSEVVNQNSYTKKDDIVEIMNDYGVEQKDFEGVTGTTIEDKIYEGMDFFFNRDKINDVLDKEKYMGRFEKAGFKVENKVKEELFSSAMKRYRIRNRDEALDGKLDTNQRVFYDSMKMNNYIHMNDITKQFKNYKINPENFEKIIGKDIETYLVDNKYKAMESKVEVKILEKRSLLINKIIEISKERSVSLSSKEKEIIADRIIKKAMNNSIKKHVDYIENIEQKIESLYKINVGSINVNTIPELEKFIEKDDYVKERVEGVLYSEQAEKVKENFKGIKERILNKDLNQYDGKQMNYLNTLLKLYGRAVEGYKRVTEKHDLNKLKEFRSTAVQKIKDIKKTIQRDLDEKKGYTLSSFENRSGEKIYIREQYHEGVKKVGVGRSENVFDLKTIEVSLFKSNEEAMGNLLKRGYDIKLKRIQDEKREIRTIKFDEAFNENLRKSLEKNIEIDRGRSR